tara:strand:+ start:124 stop:597 length:474 start_codon:yes stop_codon:yes gene_type:complete
MKRNQIIFFSAIIGGTSLAYLIYRKIKKDSLYEDVLKSIGVGTADISENDIWSPNFLFEVENSGREYQKLTNSQLKSYSDTLEEAVDGWGTNVNAIYSVMRAIPSKYEIAQLNRFYFAEHDESIIESWGDGELEPDELAKVNGIILAKPKVIYIDRQ